MSRDRGWLYGCGRCGSNVSVKNLRLRHDNPAPCEECLAVVERQVPPDGIGCGDPPSVNQELGWCGCGDHDRVEQLMLRYLTSNDPGENILRIQSDADLLVAYVADDLEWVEHGGSVYGAWLTDDGREALAVLQEQDRER